MDSAVRTLTNVQRRPTPATQKPHAQTRTEATTAPVTLDSLETD